MRKKNKSWLYSLEERCQEGPFPVIHFAKGLRIVGGHFREVFIGNTTRFVMGEFRPGEKGLDLC